MAMREFLHTVDGVRQRIPVQSHHEVSIPSLSLFFNFNIVSFMCELKYYSPLSSPDGHGSEGAQLRLQPADKGHERCPEECQHISGGSLSEGDVASGSCGGQELQTLV